VSRLLNETTVSAIADLGVSGLRYEEDVEAAFRAVGIEPEPASASFSSGPDFVGVWFPCVRDHIQHTLDTLDLQDPDVVARVLAFTRRIAAVYRASYRADGAKIVRLEHALGDDGYALDESSEAGGARGAVPESSINKAGIARLMAEMQHEFDQHPIRVPLRSDASDLAGNAAGNTTIYNGPVIHGNADGALLAWGNESVNQTQARSEQIAPGFEAITQAVVRTLEGLTVAGLAEDDRTDAESAASEVLAEVTRSEPDRAKIRRALTVLKGVLAPVAAGLATGAAAGAQDWARTAVEQLGAQF
jgi:hypothetical protein